MNNYLTSTEVALKLGFSASSRVRSLNHDPRFPKPVGVANAIPDHGRKNLKNAKLWRREDIERYAALPKLPKKKPVVVRPIEPTFGVDASLARLFLTTLRPL